MKRLILSVGALLSLAAAASAQEIEGDPPSPTLFLPLDLDRDPVLPVAEGEDSSLLAWPSISSGTALPEMKPYLTLGARVGFLKNRDADRGTWLAGAQARLHLLSYLAAEASIEFHQSRFEGGDVRVTTYPVQLTALFYPLPDLELKPYLLGGFGWYYTRVDFTGSLSAISSETDNIFGFHLGAGGEFAASPSTTLDLDVRYIFLNEPSVPAGVKKQDYDSWQLTGGVNFRF